MKQANRFYLALLVLCSAGLTGCSTPQSDETAFAAPTQMTATLAGPVDMDLRWKNHATTEAGYFVEYSPNADGKYIIIAALPPGTTKYRHPHLLPRTRFVYRVVPFFGPASNIAEIKIKKEAPQPAPNTSEGKVISLPEEKIKKSVRSVRTFTAAAPTGLLVTLMPAGGVKLDWTDHANDADGYLVEIKPEWSRDFKVSAILAPGTASMASYGFPAETRFAFRVRAFFYGQPSNLAGQTTGDDWMPDTSPQIRPVPANNP